ncbi:hypothetical protein Tco_0638987 [Tanacetum coccineum]
MTVIMMTMMMMKTLQLDQTRVSHQKGEDTTQVLLVQLRPPTKDDESKVLEETSGVLMHLLTKHIQALPQTGDADHDQEMLLLTLRCTDLIRIRKFEQSSDEHSSADEGKKKLCKADLEGPAFNLVKAFHKNNVFLQYQMDDMPKLLTNKIAVPTLYSESSHHMPKTRTDLVLLRETGSQLVDKKRVIRKRSFMLFVHKGMGLGKWSEDVHEKKQTTFITAIEEKDYRSGGSFEV